jgi:hypothetical protein
MWGSFSKFEELVLLLVIWFGVTCVLAIPVGIVWFAITHLRLV